MYIVLMKEFEDREEAIVYAKSKAEEYGFEIFVYEEGSAMKVEYTATPLPVVVRWVKREVLTIIPSSSEDKDAWPALYREMPDGTLEWIADFGMLKDIQRLLIGGKVLCAE